MKNKLITDPANESEIEAWWNEEEDEETGADVSSYCWECPDCGQPNDIGDDMVWNNKKGKHITKDTYVCEHCESKKTHYIWRR